MKTPVIILCAILAGVSAFAQGVPRVGTLKGSSQVPLVLNGKQVGSSTVPAGSQVTVLEEKDGKSLISASGGQVWVEAVAVNVTIFPAKDGKPVEMAAPDSVVQTAGAEPTVLEDPNAPPPPATKQSSWLDAVGGAITKTAEVVKEGYDSVARSPSPEAQALTPETTATCAPHTFDAAMPKIVPSPLGALQALDGIKGDALQAFLSAPVADAWGGDSEAKGAARRAVDSLSFDDTVLPQKSLSALSGSIIKHGKTKGTLRVVIEAEVDHRDTPGFSQDDIRVLTEALSDSDKIAVVELVKRTWSEADGRFREDKQLAKTVPEKVLVSNFENGSFLCRRWKGKAVIARLSVKDLQQGGTAFVLADVDWLEDNPNPVVLPSDFHYDKTLILPGQFAFLALPFEKQLPMGVCVAASALNVVKFIDPDFNLEQKELFALYNGGRSGATLPQLIGGLENVGYQTEYIATNSLRTNELVAKICASLDVGQPMVVFQPGHALTLIGYNKSTKKAFVWDQRAKGPKSKIGLPPGGTEVSLMALPNKFSHIFFIRKADEKPSREEADFLAGFIGSTAGILKHSLINSNEREESLRRYARHALPQKIAAEMRSGRTLLVPEGKKRLVTVAPKDKEPFETCTLPEKKIEEMSLSSLTRLILASDGTFYSLGK